MKILVVEDQENLAKLIKNGLVAEGFTVDYVLDGETAQRRINSHHKDYAIVVLDLMLPKKSGLEVCKEVREKGIDIPILMLTAKDGSKDVARGLNVGADDYLAKPFSFEVLIARIGALLRRPKETLTLELTAKGLVLNPTTKKVYKKKKEIKLTLKEFSLLEYLMRNINQAVSREQILSNIWDFAFDSLANVVDVHITNIRKKIGDRKGLLIETVRGVGYRISE